MVDNLFLNLNGWAWGQNENFVTESFTYLLRHLLREDAQAGAKWLARLTGGKLLLAPENMGLVGISTQTTVEEKRPDIEIAAPGWLAYVEVKVEAPLGANQLRNYRERLDKSGVENRVLALLTRYEPYIGDDQRPDVHIRWYQVANWLEDDLRQGAISEPVSVFLAQQFHEFLGQRGMTMGHVDEELGGGVPSLVSLLTVLRHVLVEQGLTVRDNMKWNNWFGFDVNAATHYVGMYVSEPTTLRFRTYYFKFKIEPKAAESAEGGRFWWDRVRWRWEKTLDLSDPRHGFYRMSTEGQMAFLRDFVKSCLEQASTMGAGTGPVELPEDDGVDEGENSEGPDGQ